MNRTPGQVYEFGSFTVDPVERVLLRDRTPVSLTQKGFDLLLFLIENSGHVVEKDRLMKEIWPDTFVEESNLTQNISVLRKVLQDRGHQYIQTVPRRGYRFVGHLQETTTETHLVVEEHARARLIIEDQISDAPTTAAVNGIASPISVAAKPVGNKVVVAVVISILLLVTVVVGLRWLNAHSQAGQISRRFDINNVTLQKLITRGDVLYGVISSDGQFVAYTTLGENSQYTLRLQHIGSKEPLPLIADSAVPVGPGAISH